MVHSNFKSLAGLIWLFCLFCPPLAAQEPYLYYEMVTGAEIASGDGAFADQGFSQRSVLGYLPVPVVDTDDVMIGPMLTFASTTTTWTNHFVPDKAYRERGYTVLSLFAAQRGDARPIHGFIVYGQRRDLSFTFGHPLHELTVGASIKHTLLHGLLPGVTPGRLTLGLVSRRFPGADRFIPYFSQRFTYGSQEVLLEYPGTVSYTYKVVPRKESYALSCIIDDEPLTPRTTEDHTQIWGVDSYRVTLMASYEKDVFHGIALQVGGGASEEYVKDFDLNGHAFSSYNTDPAPYFRVGITAFM